jgi:hypothetical protein
MTIIAKRRKYIGAIFVVGMLIALFMVFVGFVQRLFWISIVFIFVLLITLYLSMDYAYTPVEVLKYDDRQHALVFKNGTIKIDEIKQIDAKRSSDFRGLHFRFGNLYIKTNKDETYRFKYISNVGKTRGVIIYLKHNGRLPQD